MVLRHIMLTSLGLAAAQQGVIEFFQSQADGK